MKSATARSERRFQTLIKQSNDVIQLVTPEGKVLYSSDSLKKVLGYSPREVLGVDVRPYLHPDDQERFYGHWANLLKKDRNQITLEYRVKHHNGKWVWIETTLTNHVNTPNIQAVLGNFRNINERKKTEEHLRESEQALRFLAETIPQKIYTALPDGKMEYINPQWVEFSGIKLERLLRDGPKDILHPDDREDAFNRWVYSLKTGEHFSLETRMRRHDGVYRWHITRARPMRDEEGNILKWFGSSTDIHDSKVSLQREHELVIQALNLTQQREELIALNASKDEFISLASHQLRTPATIVKQYLHLILEGYLGPVGPKIEEAIARANVSNERQIEIVDDLLRVARLDAGKIELVRTTTNLVPVIQEVINQHHTIFEDRQQVVNLSYSEAGISASVDLPRMKMVLENIVDNASKYSPPGKNIEIHIKKKKSAIDIIIKDHGVGISSQDIPRLFHKFSRLPNQLSVAVGGTGLGLYWAKRIVELHGGTITVKSSPNRGAVFTVTLPM